MGNQMDQMAKFNGGYLFLKTDRPYYFAKNKVQGKIYIHLQTPMTPKHMEIEVCGHEKASYKVRRGKHDYQDVFERQIMGFKGVCFRFKGPINPGDYIIPFEFDLPDIPASILWHDSNDWSKNPSCEIIYSITSTLITHDNQQMKYSQMLVIHEQPVQFLENSQDQQTVNIKTCCCLDKGQTSINVKFNKNIFYSNETANVEVQVDNSKCLLKVNEVEFQVCQRIKLNNHFSKTYDLLENKDKAGIEPGSQLVQTKRMTLDLGSIRFKVEPTKKIQVGEFSIIPQYQEVPRSNEEIFLLSQLAPACHSVLVQNEYDLNVNVKFDGCTCCSKVPSVSIPLTVLPQTDPSQFGLQEPPGYSPINLGSFKFNLQCYSH